MYHHFEIDGDASLEDIREHGFMDVRRSWGFTDPATNAPVIIPGVRFFSRAQRHIGGLMFIIIMPEAEARQYEIASPDDTREFIIPASIANMYFTDRRPYRSSQPPQRDYTPPTRHLPQPPP